MLDARDQRCLDQVVNVAADLVEKGAIQSWERAAQQLIASLIVAMGPRAKQVLVAGRSR